MREMRDDLGNSVSDLGIEIIDFRVKRIDLPPELSSSVYERMKSERNRLAEELRAQGNELSMKFDLLQTNKGLFFWLKPIKKLRKSEVRAMQQHRLYMQNLFLKTLNFMSSPEV